VCEDEKSVLWPSEGTVRISDSEILDDMIARILLGEVDPLTPDSIYSAFVEAKKASDSWIKYYMIAVALLVMAMAGAIVDIQLFGTKLHPQFIGPTAILYFSACTLAYTNHELKMRLFRAFFNYRLHAMNGPDRAQILLRYPLAFYGGDFLAWEARPKGFVVGWAHVLNTLPMVAIAIVWRLLAVFGLLSLLVVTLHGIYEDPKLPSLVKWGVIVSFFSSLIFSGTVLRSAKTRYKYKFEELAMGTQQDRADLL
jgi:hypothetical protein